MPGRSASGSLYLAIDQGGHATRAMVFDAKLTWLAQATVPIETFYPAPDRVEHDGEALVDSIHEAVAQACHALGDRVAQLAGAGLATQRSSIVCWDRESGAVLSPVLSWQDRRGAAWLEQFRDRAATIQLRTGLVLSPHYGASKLRWCMDHLPAVAEAARRGRLACGPLASFLLFRLLQERPLVVDPANAARTQLWDLNSGDWSPELLDWFGVPRAGLPECVASVHAFGHLITNNRPIPLSVATGDQPAALFALGEPDTDTLYVNMGTGAFVQRATAVCPPPTPSLLRSVALRAQTTTTYVLEGTVNGAGSALQQCSEQLGIAEPELSNCLDDWLQRSSNPPLFMNGVAGLGSPYWVSDFASEFVGTGPAWEKIVAVVESIVFLLQVNIERMMQQGTPPRRIIASGGLADITGLLQRLADLSGLAVERPPLREATAAGLAYLLSRTTPQPPSQAVAPAIHPVSNAALQQRYQRWRREMEARINVDNDV